MSEHALESLAAKVNALELTEDEEAVLAVLITGRAEEPEVAGFGDGPTAELRGFNIGMPPTIGSYEKSSPKVSSYSVWIGGS